MKVMDYTVSDNEEKREDEMKQIELFENMGFIKSATKMCTILVKGNKATKCDEIQQDVLSGRIDVAEFVREMESKFATNKKLQQFIQFIKKSKLKLPELEEKRRREYGL